MNSTSRVLAQSSAAFMSRVYFWMMLGLAVSGVVAFQVANTPAIVNKLTHNSLLFFGLIIAQLAAVVILSTTMRSNRMNTALTALLYFVYAALSGVTFGVIVLMFTEQSIAQAFFVTSFAFIGLSAFGYLTKRDLGPIGTFCMTGLFGMIGFLLVGMLFPSIMSNAVAMTINAVGVIVFAGLTAYDTQKIKNYHYEISVTSPEFARKAAINGALMLYLDFINLFLSLLNLMGDRR